MGQALDVFLARATTEELEYAVRLVHVAGIQQRRVLGAWSLASPSPVEPSFPAGLAAFCLELYDELIRRGVRQLLCPPCLATIAAAEAGRSGDGPTTATAVASPAETPPGRATS